MLKTLAISHGKHFYIIFRNGMSKKSKKNAKIDTPAAPAINSPITLDKSNQIVLQILAKPGAKQNAITGITSEGIGVQINAPPSEGEANTELVKYISSVLGLRKSDVTFDRGFKSRQKQLKIDCMLTVDEIKQKLENEIEK